MTNEIQVYGAVIFTLVESVTSSFLSYGVLRDWGAQIEIDTQALMYADNLKPLLIQIRS